MDTSKPGLVETSVEKLTCKVNGLAMQVSRELKTGHKEAFYQRRLEELCREEGLHVEAEKRVEVWIDDSLVGHLYLDLWVEESLVVECKAHSRYLTKEALRQVWVYLAATASPVGMIYNFGRPNLEFRRVLHPAEIQEWHKYLPRVVCTPSGISLSSEISSKVQRPIRFLAASPMATIPAISTPVRVSVTESAYENSGVSIDAGNRAVELMKDAVKATYSPSVLAGIGSFGGLFDASDLKRMTNPVLVASTDGVGTKVKLAAVTGRYRGIGHDIVNHCIDDILIQGARPLFFMDYFATSRLNPEQTAEVVTGMAEACQASGMALLGGETAEMPGVYAPDEFDVAGTIVGVLERDQILPRTSALQAGDVLIGLRSSGPHTNGYSLIRKVFEETPLDTVFPELGIPLVDALLAPHRSYFPILYSQLSNLKALAHLTGGGFIENIPRILPDHLDAVIHTGSWPVPPLWTLIQQKGNITTEEMYRVFNMGIGLVAIVDKSSAAEIKRQIPEETYFIGELKLGTRKTILA